MQEKTINTKELVSPVENWISIKTEGASVSSALIDAVENLDVTTNGIDVSESWLNNKIVKRKPTTTKLTKVPVREWDELYNEVWTTHDIAYNRLTRMLNADETFKYSIEALTLKNGATISCKVKKPYLVLPDDPILYMNFVEANEMDFAQHSAHLTCVDNIRKGIKVANRTYELAVVSASQVRNLQGVFIRNDWKVTPAILAKFPKVEGIEQYKEFLQTLSGADAIVEIMTYGAASQDPAFSTRYRQYCGEEIPEKMTSLAKFTARAGMCLTSSIPFGKSWKVLHVGEVKYVWTDTVENMYRDFTYTDATGAKRKLYTEEDIQLLKTKWKESKFDGASLIRASKVVREFAKQYGIKVTPAEVVGKLIQFRWAGAKGTAFVVKDKVLDMCLKKDGTPAYKGYDLIVEDKSWKYTPSPFYQGMMAPEFELVAMSKTKFSSNLNYQFCQSLDGISFDNPTTTVNTFKKLVDKQFDLMKAAMTDPEIAKAKLGMTQSGSILDEIGVDEHEMTQRSKITKALAKYDSVINDSWWRKKFIDVFTKSLLDDCKVGKIEVEGANRFILTDPTCMLRTDLMDECGNIIIDSPDQVALGGMKDCYWANKSQEAILMRSPCIHPGEPQRVTLKSLDTIPEVIHTAFGDIPAREIFDSIKDIVVVNGFSCILDAMGGADTDGDTVLAVTDPDIVQLRSEARKTVLVTVPDDTVKEVLNIPNLKEYMIRSLKNNGIGLITNYATTIRDIQVHVQVTRKVPKKVAKFLATLRDAANKNIATNQPWVKDDVSLEAISKMNVDDWQSVYKTCNAMLKELRRLQEMAINTAKSGIWVEFGCADVTKNNYNHLAIRLRADWHKPSAKNVYESQSILGMTSKYVIERWQELHKWATSTSSSLFVTNKSDFGTNYQVVFGEVNRMRAEYGTFVNKLRYRQVDKKQFNEDFEDHIATAHAHLTLLAMQYGVDTVAAACYDASHGKDSRKNGEGASFVWNCFFEEFIAVLQYLSGSTATTRLYKMFPLPLFTYEQFADGTVVVQDRKVIFDEVQIGTVNVANGDYKLVNIDGIPFVEVPTARPTITALSASLKGEKFALTGSRFWEDKLTGGMLTTEKAVEYLTNSIGQCVIKTAYATFEQYGPEPRVACYVRISKEKDIPEDQKFMCIGVIPFDEKVLSHALSNKAIRVKVDVARATDKRIPIVVEDVVFDYNQR